MTNSNIAQGTDSRVVEEVAELRNRIVHRHPAEASDLLGLNPKDFRYGNSFELVGSIVRSKGIRLSAADAEGVLRRVVREFVVPAGAKELLQRYLANRDLGLVIDPHANTGVLLECVLEAAGSAKAIAVERFLAAQQFGATLQESDRFRWFTRLEAVDRASLASVDLVVSAPPMGLRQDRWLPGYQKRVDEVVESLYHLSGSLSDRAEILLFIPAQQLVKRDKGSVIGVLQAEGWFVHAAISLPPGSMAPMTGIDVALVALKRRETNLAFAATASSVASIDAIVGNWLAQRGSKYAELGSMVDPTTLSSPKALLARSRLDQLGQRTGGSRFDLGSVAAIRTFSKAQQTEFENAANSVYWANFGTSPAILSLDDAKTARDAHIQFECDPAVLRADYLQTLLNGDYGPALREACISGNYIQRIDKAQLATAPVFLPPLVVQEQVIALQAKIGTLRAELVEAERDLWRYPRRVAEWRRRVDSVNHVHSVENWIQALPFPLASILWRYHANRDAKAKVEHLLHFFEATAQFFVAITLSAIFADKTFFETQWRDLLGNGFDKATLRRPTFGTWIELGQRLSAAIRRLASKGPDEEALVRSVFRVEGRGVPQMVTAAELFGVLSQVSRWRNDWKGHGGVVSELENARRLTMLEEQLGKLREVLAEGFGQYILVRAGVAGYDGELHRVHVELLMGRDAVFRQTDVESIEPMISGKLYMVDADVRRPLPLLPFFSMMAPPTIEENACYFFNRIESGGERWVSYHYEQRGEIVLADQRLSPIIELFSAN
jgi:hypothetical protein